MLGKYLTKRSGGVKFLALAILFSLFVVDTKSDGSQWARSIAFLFFSFMVFRFIDDAGSVAIDRREHPERTYLDPTNYLVFLRWTIVLTFAYLLAILVIDLRAFYVLSALITISTGCYRLFREQKFPLELIPLVKYPVLLWCLAAYPTDLNIVAPLSATFFIVLTHDLSEKVQDGKLHLIWGIGPLLLSGLLVTSPWNDPVEGWLILPVLGLTLVFQRSKYIRYLPVLYYPILAFIIKIN